MNLWFWLLANLTYRLFPTANYLLMRIIHGSLQLTAVIFVGLAIYAVYYSKSQSSREKDRHFQSTHSWMGLIVISVIILQVSGIQYAARDH
jgi:Eukaryotic cytochrome b561